LTGHSGGFVARLLRVAFLADGMIAQFDGFDALQELDLDVRPGQRIDWVSDARGLYVSAFRVLKQLDILMLFYLLGEDEFRELLDMKSRNRSCSERRLITCPGQHLIRVTPSLRRGAGAT
jgi:trehalose/maltose hydrolase-like predicted phosphorylase